MPGKCLLNKKINFFWPSSVSNSAAPMTFSLVIPLILFNIFLVQNTNFIPSTLLDVCLCLYPCVYLVDMCLCLSNVFVGELKWQNSEPLQNLTS